MSILIELEETEERQLQLLAQRERRPAGELCREVVRSYIEQNAPGDDGYAILRRMIGIAKGGPKDSSLYHDLRPGEAE